MALGMSFYCPETFYDIEVSKPWDGMRDIHASLKCKAW